MKASKSRKEKTIAMKIDGPLKRKIEETATVARRSFADQAAFLIEKGLAALEKAKQEAASA